MRSQILPQRQLNFVFVIAVCFGAIQFNNTIAQAQIFGPSYQKQAESIEKGIKLLIDSGSADPGSLTSMYSSSAMLHLQAGDTSKAIERIDQALGLCRDHKLENSYEYLLTIASNVLAKSDEDAASRFLASQLSQKDNRAYLKAAFKVFGDQLFNSGKLVQSIQAQHEYVQLIKEDSPESEEEVRALQSYGRACLAGRMFDLGVPVLKRSRQIAVKLKNPVLEAQAAFDFATGLIGAGDHRAASEVLTQAVARAEATQETILLPSLLDSLTRAQIMLKQYDQANQTADAIQQKFPGSINAGIAQTMQIIIRLAKSRDANDGFIKADFVKQAIPDQQAAIKTKSASLPSGAAAIMMPIKAMTTGPDQLTLACFYALTGEVDAARGALKVTTKGINGFEKSMKVATDAGAMNSDVMSVAVADQRAAVAEVRQRLLIAEERHEDALVVSERARATAQAELMRKKLGVVKKKQGRRKSGGVMTLERIKAVAADQQTTLVVYSLIHALDPFTRSYFALDDPISNPQSIYCWVVTPAGAVHFENISLASSKLPLNTLVSLARKQIQVGPAEGEVSDPTEPGQDEAVESVEIDQPNKIDVDPANNAEPAARTLHRLLIEPTAKHLPTGEGSRITIIPQGSLFLVPFAALPDADGSPLIMQHTVAVSPSIQTLELAKQQHAAVKTAARKEILIVGNPAMPKYLSRPDRPATSLTPLAGAEAEAEYLGQTLDVKPLIGKDATESTVVKRMEQARFIHLATHGLLESENVFAQSYLSAIALAPGDSDDGFLTVRETMKLKLNAELAVLSACDTGRGRISGDGVIGLSRGYIAAGVPTVVVSLWPVSDAATMVLMSLYYESMLKGADKAAALRTAMLKTRQDFPNPKDWAPFTIYGYAR